MDANTFRKRQVWRLACSVVTAWRTGSGGAALTAADVDYLVSEVGDYMPMDEIEHWMWERLERIAPMRGRGEHGAYYHFMETDDERHGTT